MNSLESFEEQIDEPLVPFRVTIGKGDSTPFVVNVTACNYIEALKEAVKKLEGYAAQ